MEEKVNVDALTARMAGLHVPKQKTTLLSLPGELRNYIYSHCKEESPVRIKHIHRGNQKSGGFRSLTQVCRIIRGEFRPLHIRETVYRIYHASQLRVFIGAFYSSDAEYSAIENHRGNLIIPLHSLAEPDSFSLNISLIFTFASKAPGVKCRFDCHRSMSGNLDEQVCQLSGFLEALQDPTDETRSKFVLDVAPTIMLDGTRSHITLTFLFKTAFELDEYKKTIFDWWIESAQLEGRIADYMEFEEISYEQVVKEHSIWLDIASDEAIAVYLGVKK